MKCYSIDDENYSMLSIGDVLDELSCSGELEVGQEYTSADAVNYSAEKFIGHNVDYILENLDQNLYDNGMCENWDSGFSIAPEAAIKELELFLIDWTKRHTRLEQFYSVENVESCKITQEDVDSML
jgi:hypothetical protein